MYKKVMFFLLPLAAATGPVAYYSGPEWVAEAVHSISGKSDASEGGAQAANSKGQSELGQSLLAGPAVSDFTEVLRFDLTPAWIVNRWPRVSTGLAQLGLQGYRVPLVTGTSQHDLAGALTYYFNYQQQVQRITFRGTTGDHRRLVQFLTAYYGFVRRPTNSPGVFLFEVPRNDAEAQSFLWIEPAGVLKYSEPYQRFDLTLTLERPGNAP
jgi:hypothetical protein